MPSTVTEHQLVTSSFFSIKGSVVDCRGLITFLKNIQCCSVFEAKKKLSSRPRISYLFDHNFSARTAPDFLYTDSQDLLYLVFLLAVFRNNS
jgi:hypothetical protein